MTKETLPEITFAVPTYIPGQKRLSRELERSMRREAKAAARKLKLQTIRRIEEKAAPFKLARAEASEIARRARKDAAEIAAYAASLSQRGDPHAVRHISEQANKASRAARRAEKAEANAIKAVKACYAASPDVMRRKEAERVAVRKKLLEKITDPAVLQLIERGTRYENVDYYARLPLALHLHNAGASSLFIAEIFGIHRNTAQALVEHAKRRAASGTERRE